MTSNVKSYHEACIHQFWRDGSLSATAPPSLLPSPITHQSICEEFFTLHVQEAEEPNSTMFTMHNTIVVQI